MEEVLAKRNEIREANRTGVYPACEGCYFLEERNWPDQQSHLIRVMDIAMASACQLRCKYCYTVLLPEIASNSTYDLYQICREFIDNGWLSPNANIVWTGGEPTLFKRFDDVLSMLMFGNIRHRLFTNAFRFSDSVALGMQTGRLQLICSPDAGTPETYAAVKGRNCFEQIKEVCAQYARVRGDFRLKYVCISENANRKDADGFLDMIRQLHINHIFLDVDHGIPTIGQSIIDTLGYILAKARQSGVNVDFYDGVKGYPELRLPERIEFRADECKRKDPLEGGCCLVVTPKTGLEGLTPLRMVSISLDQDAIRLCSSGSDPGILLPEFPLPAGYRAMITADITVGQQDLMEVFYIPEDDTDYRQQNSVSVLLEPGRNHVLMTAFPLYGCLKGRVRLDPGIHAGEYLLHHLEVSTEKNTT